MHPYHSTARVLQQDVAVGSYSDTLVGDVHFLNLQAFGVPGRAKEDEARDP